MPCRRKGNLIGFNLELKQTVRVRFLWSSAAVLFTLCAKVECSLQCRVQFSALTATDMSTTKVGGYELAVVALERRQIVWRLNRLASMTCQQCHTTLSIIIVQPQLCNACPNA